MPNFNEEREYYILSLNNNVAGEHLFNGPENSHFYNLPSFLNSAFPILATKRINGVMEELITGEIIRENSNINPPAELSYNDCTEISKMEVAILLNALQTDPRSIETYVDNIYKTLSASKLMAGQYEKNAKAAEEYIQQFIKKIRKK